MSMLPILAASVLVFCLSVDASIEVQEAFRSLFNGKDLEGWNGDASGQSRDMESAGASTREPQRAFKDHWSVEGGELVNDGEGPWAATDEEFGDVELTLEYRTAAADAGIYLKGTAWLPFREIARGRGEGMALADPAKRGWNRVRVRQIGSRTWVWLNGRLVVEDAVYDDHWNPGKPLPPKGRVCLWAHGGESRWRHIFIRRVPPEEANALLRERDVSAGFVSLFDGKTLKGWTGAVRSYSVAEGTLQCNGGGNLFTEREYADFEALLEFKLAPGANSGLAVRYPGTGTPGYAGMCEIQVLEDTHPSYAKLDPRQYHGSVYGMIAALRGYQRPPGEWNYQKVRVQGHEIEVELNGTVIVRGDVSKVTEFKGNAAHPGRLLRTGHFGFAGHGKGVAFRHLFIREL